MKIYQTLCLGAVIAITQSTFAQTQAPIANDVLGMSEGTLDFCSKANPKAVPQYVVLGKNLVANAPAADVATARNSQTYKDSYNLIETTLRKLPKEHAAKVCTDLAGK